MLVIVNKPCHAPHAPRITINMTYTETCAILVTRVVDNDRQFIGKKHLPVCSEKATRRKNRRKTGMEIPKLFVLHANTIRVEICHTFICHNANSKCMEK